MAKVFTVDVAKCNGCYTCVTVCKDEHVDNDWTPYAKPQPEIGQFWVNLKDYVEGTLPKVKSHYIAEFCNHCERPACLKACTVDAIEKREDGLVLINPEKCTGCDACIAACPYDAIYKNKDLGICQKCTGCAHLLDAGEKLPRCVEACPTDALWFGEESELQDFIIGSTVRKPETGTSPKVFYRNIPGKFIAGTIFDPDEQEVIIGATVRATNGGKMWEVLTDDFGDFWIKDLAQGIYDLVIEAEGYEYKTFKALDVRTSVNIGDIAMTQKKD
jgi:tetrathionate reductase subunit B